MPFTSFRDLRTWQEARSLVREIYADTRTWRDFGLRDQLQRAAVSVMANIAEGSGRGGTAQFRFFLGVAQGSAAEVRSLLQVAADLGYLHEDRRLLLDEAACAIGKMLHGLTASLKKRDQDLQKTQNGKRKS